MLIALIYLFRIVSCIVSLLRIIYVYYVVNGRPPQTKTECVFKWQQQLMTRRSMIQ